ncbi:hypothetical protein [Streptomyces flaveolus]|uniref:hypothetical protein n=1 Tax=Streptomyces flaveolus TaxID=67297 RepID=UPI00166FA80C|nr:hypothetical protein [Streptomyces flaveolus]GGQ98572.1 hypothetical protein GCM10010216_71280 [Streptomyces flaveolus]
MEMNHREPQAGLSDEFAGASGGRAVWESELPWDFPLDDFAVGEPLAAAAGQTPGGGHGAHQTAGPYAAHSADAYAAPPAGPDSGAGHGAAAGPGRTAALPAAAPAYDAEPATPDAEDHELPQTPRDTGRRPRGRRPHGAADERRPSRGHLAKPLLAGAGVLSALFLLAPHLLNDDAPSQTVQAGAEDVEPDFAPAIGSPGGATASPRPESPEAARKDGTTAGQDRIAEVAATAPTQSGRPIAAMSEPSAEASRTAGGTSTAEPATPRASTTQPSTPQEHYTSKTVYGTSVLQQGQSWSTNRVFLGFQGDGNLVLYNQQGTPLWWSGTVGQGAVKAVFQADGNLALYAGDGRTVWSTHTEGHDGARLVLRADGNMVIEYGGTVIWSSGTAM